ncbi:MAG: PQQ-dependent sugar dehydrogenase [Bryobacteraceae bacterium]|nr:PQQ-dependent sugar dehydrogenase [Bryobacteraceae bacterium]
MKLLQCLCLIVFAALPAKPQIPSVRLAPYVEGLTRPTDIQAPPDGSGRLFITQQAGVIRVVRNGALLEKPFLDISDKTEAEVERGLLGLAFPPDFAQSRVVYICYTEIEGDVVVARYRVKEDNPDEAAADSARVVIRVEHREHWNHNGGQLQFGPDGYLYLGVGDGGDMNDVLGSGQNPQSLLGKLMRFEVSARAAEAKAAPGNPFEGNPQYRPEIWALGLRNPWRFSFDRLTGDLYIADVGQDRAEEVNFQPAGSRGGENYGWSVMEGMQCFAPDTPGYVGECDPSPYVMPVVEYDREVGCSVSGGYVYRGTKFPGLAGWYLYADFCTGQIFGLRLKGETWEHHRVGNVPGVMITTFGQDTDGELYVADWRRGVVYRVEEEPVAEAPRGLGWPPQPGRPVRR